MPTAPTDVIISDVAATSVHLGWSYKGSEDLQYYVIQYKPKNANQVKIEIKLNSHFLLSDDALIRYKHSMPTQYTIRTNILHHIAIYIQIYTARGSHITHAHGHGECSMLE